MLGKAFIFMKLDMFAAIMDDAFRLLLGKLRDEVVYDDAFLFPRL
jgi:hypothetical protein